MNYQSLRRLTSLYFSYHEVAAELGIEPASARVLCSRYVSNGLLVRAKRNIYVLRERWDHMNENEIMQIANIIQVPSYISLTAALSYYGYTTQVQQGFIESVCVQRSIDKRILNMEFNYTKISRKYYSHFDKMNNVFIATPEKALVDAIYLHSFGKYSLDFSALDISKFDPTGLKKLLDRYPERIARRWRQYGPP